MEGGEGGGGDYFSGFLIQEVKLAGTRAGGRQAGRWVAAGQSRRAWCRWAVYKGQRCHWHALHLLCQLPWFSHRGKKRTGYQTLTSFVGFRWTVQY